MSNEYTPYPSGSKPPIKAQVAQPILISIGLDSIVGVAMNKIHGGSFIAGWTNGITVACLVIQVFGNSLGTVF